ncbi:MAG: glutamyl-tRNA reductase [Chitinophagales bacterium]|nr:glutamyl-tRNA reductase [Chitinophagales bacterium]
MSLERYRVITFTHKTTHISSLKDYLITEEEVDYPAKKLGQLKALLQIDELLYLKTCNRVTFVFTASKDVNDAFLVKFFKFLSPEISEELIKLHIPKAMVLQGKEAVDHFFGVAASLDSLVVGEREILGQIKDAYQASKNHGYCGDGIRMLVEQAIVFAKKIYSETKIGEKPISVVSLAFRELIGITYDTHAKILMIGAGQTNNLMSVMLKKAGFEHITVLNRTKEKADQIASRHLFGKSLSLDMLKTFSEDFDILISCTGAPEHILTEQWASDVQLSKTKKYTFIDLAVPADIDPQLCTNHSIHLIDVASLEVVAQKNMEFRKNELKKAQLLLQDFLEEFTTLAKQRELELALTQVPIKVKAVRERAVSKVFKKDIEQLDDNSKEILEKMMDYFEKKYIAIPMKLAKKTLLNIDTNKF